jgi:hypothetical protein
MAHGYPPSLICSSDTLAWTPTASTVGDELRSLCSDLELPQPGHVSTESGRERKEYLLLSLSKYFGTESAPFFLLDLAKTGSHIHGDFVLDVITLGKATLQDPKLANTLDVRLGGDKDATFELFLSNHDFHATTSPSSSSARGARWTKGELTVYVTSSSYPVCDFLKKLKWTGAGNFITGHRIYCLFPGWTLSERPSNVFLGGYNESKGTEVQGKRYFETHLVASALRSEADKENLLNRYIGDDITAAWKIWEGDERTVIEPVQRIAFCWESGKGGIEDYIAYDQLPSLLKGPRPGSKSACPDVGNVCCQSLSVFFLDKVPAILKKLHDTESIIYGDFADQVVATAHGRGQCKSSTGSRKLVILHDRRGEGKFRKLLAQCEFGREEKPSPRTGWFEKWTKRTELEGVEVDLSVECKQPEDPKQSPIGEFFWQLRTTAAANFITGRMVYSLFADLTFCDSPDNYHLQPAHGNKFFGATEAVQRSRKLEKRLFERKVGDKYTGCWPMQSTEWNCSLEAAQRVQFGFDANKYCILFELGEWDQGISRRR